MVQGGDRIWGSTAVAFDFDSGVLCFNGFVVQEGGQDLEVTRCSARFQLARCLSSRTGPPVEAFGVWGLGFGVWGLGLGVWGSVLGVGG